MDNDGESTVIGVLMLVALAMGLLLGTCNATTSSYRVDPDTVKATPTECRLERYNNAQKYIESCQPAFKQAAESVK
jgi:hypothetical protein